MSSFQPYVVQRGDTLWDIARRQTGSGQNWHQLYETNRDVVGANPNLIYPGQRLNFPAVAPQPQAPSHTSPPAKPLPDFGMGAFGDDAPGRVAFEDAGFAPPMVPRFDNSAPTYSPATPSGLPPFGGGVADNAQAPIQMPPQATHPQQPQAPQYEPVNGFADKRLPPEVRSMFADAQRQVDTRDAMLNAQLAEAKQQLERQRKGSALAAMFGNRSFIPDYMRAQQAYYNFANHVAEQSRLGQHYMRKLYEQYDPATIDAQHKLGQLDIGRRNAATNERRATTGEANSRISQGQLDRQTAADVYRQKHDSELLQQQQAENMARQSTAAQDAMVRAMLGQQASKDRAADRQSRESIAAAGRANVLKVAGMRDDYRSHQADDKLSQQADKTRRQRLTKLEATLNKPPKGINMDSFYDEIASEFDVEKQQAVARSLHKNALFQALPKNSPARQDMYIRALLASGLSTNK